ncbi:YcfL family protein [Shewanella insulae]|uniref:YcfL family protein n=1 Tax=Shewanella insulae TaxID=2681496 RepID=UPI001EFDA414|nr:YcfL family protein [Shewanella insulae]MCG9755492.1 YcfL family protein [Shewanella insulae]
MNKGLLLGSLLMGLSACAPHTGGIMISSTGEVRVDNGSFHSDVDVSAVTTQAEAGFLRARGTIISKSPKDQRLQYKFTWYDINGATVEDEGVSWKSLKLHGKQQMQVTALSPNASAVRCELYVREAISN